MSVNLRLNLSHATCNRKQHELFYVGWFLDKNYHKQIKDSILQNQDQLISH